MTDLAATPAQTSTRRRFSLRGEGRIELVALPVLILLSEGFHSADAGWSLAAYTDFFSEPLNRTVFLRTLRLGAEVTAVSAVIGYAAAFAIVNLPPKGKGRMVGLVVLPLMISPVARTYAWIVTLGRTGIVNEAIRGLGLSASPLTACVRYSNTNNRIADDRLLCCRSESMLPTSCDRWTPRLWAIERSSIQKASSRLTLVLWPPTTRERFVTCERR